MMDTVTAEKRSQNMSAIRSTDTKPEIYVRKLLFASGFRYRLYSKHVPGHPDLWLKKYHTAVFVHGCFWHRHRDCKYAYTPKSRTEFWMKKFDQNIRRDAEVRNQLQEAGIRCLVIWECTIRATQKRTGDPEQLVSNIRSFLESEKIYGEI